MRLKFLSLTNLTLLVALALSTVAEYYSIMGLMAIFAGAVIPIIIMGIILGVSKLTTTVWLRTYWARCSFLMKAYLVPSVIVLALITSMGIFGFLSKAHIDQGIGTGEVSAKVALIDEKVKTQRENIKSSRDALAQMDLQVNNVITKGDTEKSAERSVQIRRQQAKERGTLQKEIEVANKEIGKLNEERAPIASQLRKVEAEVGPIKYIAAMIYGDNPDANILERAVRWVIILLVAVFDPLAIAMLLASRQSKEWDEEDPKEEEERAKAAVDFHLGPDDTAAAASSHAVASIRAPDPLPVMDQHTPVDWPEVDPQESVNTQAPLGTEFEKVLHDNLDDLYETADVLPVAEAVVETPPVEVPPEPITAEVPTPEYSETGPGYVSYHGKHMNKDVLRGLRPDLFLEADHTRKVNTNFGIVFPETAFKGDMFVRVDTLPNQVYKFDGAKWIVVNKEQTGAYLDNQAYLKFLVDKIAAGEYDVDLLSENEKQQVEEYLNSTKA